MKTTTLTIHTVAYRRRHGRPPSTGDGSKWTLRATKSPYCGSDDLSGPEFTFSGTLASVINEMRNQGLTGQWSILP